MSTSYKYLFGPVVSRRFGRSLGIDLVPFKTCPYDCVFCELGSSTRTTDKRDYYADIDQVVAELSQWLAEDGQADCLTLAGSGEPTLHMRFGEVLSYIHEQTLIPSVLLTNGALFSQKDVRDQACLANTVKASLSAFDQASFEAVNRPDSAIDFAGLVEGLKTFGREYQGEYRLEVFVIPGVNAEDEQLRRIAAFAREIQPSRVQLNCAVRPAAESYVDGVSQQRLLEIATLFDPPAEVIPDFSGVQQIHEATTEAIYNVICRRPCTAMELANVFGCHINEIGKHLGKLGYEERIRSFRQGKSIYFAPVGRSLADHS